MSRPDLSTLDKSSFERVEEGTDDYLRSVANFERAVRDWEGSWNNPEKLRNLVSAASELRPHSTFTLRSTLGHTNAFEKGLTEYLEKDRSERDSLREDSTAHGVYGEIDQALETTQYTPEDVVSILRKEADANAAVSELADRLIENYAGDEEEITEYMSEEDIGYPWDAIVATAKHLESVDTEDSYFDRTNGSMIF